jgi:hypothetical protein
MKALPILLRKTPSNPTRQLRNQAAMNMELFRYLTVAQVKRNAITAGEISNESAM